MNQINCRVCLDLLTSKNTAPSFLKRMMTICRSCHQQKVSDRNRDRRFKILEKLGNECQCCRVKEPKILSIDHIYGGGHKERREIGKWSKYIKKLFTTPKEELLLTYQCLCFNCNYTKGFWKKCPHQIALNNSDKYLQFYQSPLPVSDRGVDNSDLPEEEKHKRRIILRKIQKVKVKLEMIKAYGGSCSWCKISHPLFLTLDHINNNGNLESKRGGVEFYQYLKRLGYPGKDTQLQLLCHNCNALKEYSFNRLDKTEIIKMEPEKYIQQKYETTEEQDDLFWEEASKLYAQINC